MISDIDETTPAAGAPAGQGDDQIRALKADIKESFPNIDAAVTPSPDDLNILLGADTAGLTPADLSKLADVDATADEIDILDGATISTAQLNFLSDVSGNVQTSLDARIQTIKITDESGNTISVGVDSSGNANYTITGGAGINTAVAGSTVTISAETATETNAGILEIATTAEAQDISGNDKIMTPARIADLLDGTVTDLVARGALQSGTGVWIEVDMPIDASGNMSYDFSSIAANVSALELTWIGVGNQSTGNRSLYFELYDGTDWNDGVFLHDGEWNGGAETAEGSIEVRNINVAVVSRAEWVALYDTNESTPGMRRSDSEINYICTDATDQSPNDTNASQMARATYEQVRLRCEGSTIDIDEGTATLRLLWIAP